MKHICVVGGGIAGMVACRKLLAKGYRVTLLEASKRLGGRLFTVHRTQDGMMYESGAARFNFQHRRWLRLLQSLHIVSYSMNSVGKTYVRDGMVRKADTDRVLQEAFVKSKEYSPTYLKARTLETFLREIFPDDMVDHLIYAFGYRSEFDTMNAWDALHLFQREFQETVAYYSLSEGMTAVVKKLEQELLKHSQCTVRTEHTVTAYSYHKGKCHVHHAGGVLVFDHVMFCTTKRALQKITGLEANQRLQASLKSSVARPLHRIYARFPVNARGRPWFHDMGRITTNNMLGYIIPIRPHQGLIMISYTDGEQARLWNQMAKVGILQEEIMKQVRKLFPNKRIPAPLWVDSQYWEEGAHYWGLQPVKYRNTRDTVQRYGYTIAGEAFSTDHQGWIEGALQSVDAALRHVPT